MGCSTFQFAVHKHQSLMFSICSSTSDMQFTYFNLWCSVFVLKHLICILHTSISEVQCSFFNIHTFMFYVCSSTSDMQFTHFNLWCSVFVLQHSHIYVLCSFFNIWYAVYTVQSLMFNVCSSTSKPSVALSIKILAGNMSYSWLVSSIVHVRGQAPSQCLNSTLLNERHFKHYRTI